MEKKVPAERSVPAKEGAVIIVGIDAGGTTAVAFVDLSGVSRHVESRKHWRLEEVIECIARASPAVIACDTNPTSKLARLLSRAFGARLFFPKHSLRVLEKERIAAKTGLKAGNKHERDALAAAVAAYNHYGNKLRQAAKKAGKAGADARHVQRQVLKGVKIAHAARKLGST